MKKIAIVSKNLEINGISQVIVNYCTNIDLKKYDVNIFAGVPINDNYKKECEKKGIKIINLPKKGIKYYANLYKRLKENKYDIVHIHGSSATIGIEVMISVLCRIKKRIVHSHNTTCQHIFVHKLLKPILNLLATEKIACGYESGKWMFSKKFTVINNGINVSEFIYSYDEKRNLKKEYGLEDFFVIGHIGRFNQQKNQEYLLELISKLKNHKIALVLVGIGPDYEKIKEKAKTIEGKIVFVGETTNPAKFYNMFDLFLLPSMHEGLPVVLIEAQASALPCIVSENVTTEANITETIEYISLEKINIWKKKIIEASTNKNDRMKKSIENIEILKEKGFDIKINSITLEEIYDK